MVTSVTSSGARTPSSRSRTRWQCTVLKRELLNDRGICDVYLALGDVETRMLQEAGKVAKAVPVAGQGMGLIVKQGNPLGIKGIGDLASPKVQGNLHRVGG